MAWLKDCEICNSGLCKAVDERKEQGLTEHAACKEMSEESEGLYSTDAILGRYRYYTGKTKVCEVHKEIPDPPNAEEFIKKYMQDDVYKLTPVGLKIARQSTKAEWWDFGLRLKELMAL